jgi:NADPH-dependent 2,4-dienoyl-CoA reductase/sulfur reductase-like enzyme/nitrite reductase/ring-hydroxylating ferredoxin subunit
MSSQEGETKGPDFGAGIAESDVPANGLLAGHVGEDAVVLVRAEQEYYAIGASCTHYGGPLAEGLLDGHSVHCPWHHACFDVRTGEARGAPALNPVPCWKVERANGRLRVTGKQEHDPLSTMGRTLAASQDAPKRIVIIGGGAAGSAAAEMLRREGYTGDLTLVDADADAPYDRPNISKDYLAGEAPEEWIPLRPEGFYAGYGIEHLRGTRATSIDTARHTVTLDDGRTLQWDRLLLATGATAVRLDIPGAELPHVHTLRSLADSRSIIAASGSAKRAVVIGASFIGLEVAASLRHRGIEVHVVAPDERPLERVLGAQLGDHVRALHEQHGVSFHLGRKPAAIEADGVKLDSGERLAADLVVMGVGVRPDVSLAEGAGIQVDRGVLVDRRLETNASCVFAAGDIARYPDPRTGEPIRIEHWVHAQRMGQAAARSMLDGGSAVFTDVPFFWSQHYDVAINYVGHAARWDTIETDGDLQANNARVRYLQGGRVQAVVTIGRDQESLAAELAFAREAMPAPKSSQSPTSVK